MQIVLNCFGNRMAPNTMAFDNSKMRKVEINAEMLGSTQYKLAQATNKGIPEN